MRKFLSSIVLVLALGTTVAQAAPAAPPKENIKDRPSIPQVAFTLDGKPGDTAQLQAHSNRPLHYVVDIEGNLAIFTNEAMAEAHAKKMPDAPGQQQDDAAANRDASASAEMTTSSCPTAINGYTTLYDYDYFCGPIVDLSSDVGDLWYKSFDNRANSIHNTRNSKTRYWTGYYNSGSSLTLPAYYSLSNLTYYGWSNIISSVDVNAW